jgi:hypothetical protein
LVTLLDTDELKSDVSAFGEILKMRQHYLKLFQRKLYAAKCTYIDYAQFRNVVEKIKIFAKLMELFFQ